MANINWKSGVNGSFDTSADWTGGVVPGAADSVAITTAGSYVVTMTGAESVQGLVMNNASADLLDTSGQILNIGTSFTVALGLFSLENGGQIFAPGATVRVGPGGGLQAIDGNEQITAANFALSGTLGVGGGTGGLLGLTGGGSIGAR